MRPLAWCRRIECPVCREKQNVETKQSWIQTAGYCQSHFTQDHKGPAGLTKKFRERGSHVSVHVLMHSTDYTTKLRKETHGKFSFILIDQQPDAMNVVVRGNDTEMLASPIVDEYTAGRQTPSYETYVYMKLLT